MLIVIVARRKTNPDPDGDSPAWGIRTMTIIDNYKRAERISIRLHRELSEKWIQNLLAADPALLGLGRDLVLIDKERRQPKAGRLDLLFQDHDTKRYEVELQLGPTDESHIVRCIEYWDNEAKRYPDHDHCAVIIAEDILTRFLNVIALFNRAIPLVAIQMQAYKIGEHFTLVFTKVLDERSLGATDRDEGAEPTDRKYWEEKRASPETLRVTDNIFAIVKEFDPSLEMKYNKVYIGLARHGVADNFVIFRPTRQFTSFEPRVSPTEEIDKKLEAAGFDVNYDDQWKRYKIRLSQAALLNQHVGLFKELIGLAFEPNSA